MQSLTKLVVQKEQIKLRDVHAHVEASFPCQACMGFASLLIGGASFPRARRLDLDPILSVHRCHPWARNDSHQAAVAFAFATMVRCKPWARNDAHQAAVAFAFATSFCSQRRQNFSSNLSA